MKRISLFCMMFLFFIGFAREGSCADSELSQLISKSLGALNVEKGSADLGVLTNANYVRLFGKTTEKYVDEIAAATGCSIGKGNLLFLNVRPKNSLLIALGNKKTFQSIIIRYDGTKAKSSPLSLKAEDLEKPDYFWDAMQGASGKQTFHLVTILGAWMTEAPYDFLKTVELHGHICPGIFFGYITAKGVEQKLPLKHGEQYIYIGSPNECKDDAMQVLLGVTAGKRTMFIKKLSEGQIIETPGRVVTGVVIKWSKMDGEGTGLVTSIDLDAIKIITDVGKEKSPNQKMLASRKLLGWLSETEMFFRVEKEFHVDKKLKEQLISAGVNPYERLKMTPGTVATPEAAIK